jgi:hypothetical protein
LEDENNLILRKVYQLVLILVNNVPVHVNISTSGPILSGDIIPFLFLTYIAVVVDTGIFIAVTYKSSTFTVFNAKLLKRNFIKGGMRTLCNNGRHEYGDNLKKNPKNK